MLPRLRSCRTAALAPRPSPKPTSPRLERCSFCGSALSPSAALASGKGKERETTKFRSRPAYEPPFASTSAFRFPSARHASSSPSPSSSKSSLEPLSAALADSHFTRTIQAIKNLSLSDRQLLPRETFDAAFTLVSGARRRRDGSPRLPHIQWGTLKGLRELAQQRGWSLADEQKRRMFEVGVRWDEVRDPTREGTRFDTSPERERYRGQFMKELSDEFIVLPRAEADKERDVLTLERYLRTTRRHDKWKLDSAQRSEPDVVQQLSHVKPLVSPDARVLVDLFSRDRAAALAHLHTMLDEGRTPSLAFMEQQALSDEVDMYEKARKDLDSACRGGLRSMGSAVIDGLLVERLARLDLEDWTRAHPAAAFLKWLPAGPSAVRKGDPAKAEWVLLAFRLWQVFEDDVAPPDSPMALEAIISEALVVEAAQIYSPRDPPSPLLARTVEAATTYLPADRLVFLSHRLLRATSLGPQFVPLARHLYISLRTRAPLDSPTPFQWHASLLAPFTFLLRTSITPPLLTRPVPQLSSLPFQLYLDWTSSGLTVPANAWPLIWRGVGHDVSSIEVIRRVVDDYERSGQVLSPNVATTVLSAACTTHRVVLVLRLLSYFRTKFPGRSAPTPPSLADLIRPHHDPPAVPLKAYNNVLRLLASATHDRRLDSLGVFRLLVADGLVPDMGTWNALLAGHVFRPGPMTLADLRAAEKVDELVRERRDALTDSLLLHGYTRFARDSNREAGKKGAFEKAVGVVERAGTEGRIVRGKQVAGLVRALGRRGRWEEAKRVGEVWWKAVEGHAKEEEWEREMEEGMQAVRDAGREVQQWEIAEAESWRKRRAKRAAVQEERDKTAAEVEPELEGVAFSLGEVDVR